MGSVNRITGIYKITNLVNGKCYVGQSVNIKKRWEYYKYGSKDHTPIISAIRKYGIENFEFSIIEECTNLELNEREIHWIAETNCICPNGYNLSTGGRQTTWAYKPSPETLRLRSIALTGKKRTAETILKMSLAQKGRKKSPEQVEKMRLASTGRPSPNKGKPMSEEAKAKMIATKTGTAAPWKYRSVIRNDGVIFESLKAAAEAINATYRGIIRVLNGERKLIYGWSFMYFDGGVPSQQ